MKKGIGFAPEDAISLSVAHYSFGKLFPLKMDNLFDENE